jgi:hypothetical protein
MFMNIAISLAIATLISLVGAIKVIWPAMLIDREADAGNGEPTPEELRRSRWHGMVMLAFGVIGLYAILTWDGTPAEFIGV